MLHRSCIAVFILALAAVAIHAEPFTVSDPGTEKIIDYARYGVFEGVDTDRYAYRIVDSSGLKAAAGEGIYPNTDSVLQDPGYRQALAENRLQGNQWDFVQSEDHRTNFYKWATAREEDGVRQFYTALALEKGGDLVQAIKAYYAVIVHFPESAGETYWKTPWYVGPAAINKIQFLTREHPELGMKLVGAQIKVKDGFGSKKSNTFTVNPGKIVAVTPQEAATVTRCCDLSKIPVKKTVGNGRVKLLQHENGHWQLTLDGKPFVVRGIAYSPCTAGLSPDFKTYDVTRTWMYDDTNHNDRIDGPYDSFVDANRNNMQDPGEDPVGDFQLMKDMGVSTLRLYHHEGLNKRLLRDGYEKYGFMYLMGDFLGMYAKGSQADWAAGTDYTNPEHRKNMLESVRVMVLEYRDEPYVLMWVLGNETNYGTPQESESQPGTGSRARLQPEVYYAFVNEAAKLIKSLDPQQRPVAICNGDTLFLDKCAAGAPDIDVFGANSYRGEQGFGSLWQDVADVYGRPVLITEYGCSAFKKGGETAANEASQARYHRGNWKDIESNLGGAGVGNALGGVIFEWNDEWWKGGKTTDPNKHDEIPQFGAPFLDSWSYEEWLGIASQGNGKLSPFLRQLRPAYEDYRKMWAGAK